MTDSGDFRFAAIADDPVLKITLGYDGAGFAGSQRQPGRRTVQAILEEALSILAGREASVVLAGRTDEGVHAAGQVAGTGDIRPDWSSSRYLLALNALLPDDCSVSSVDRVDDGFHARFDARWREYRYRIWIGPRQAGAWRWVWQRHGAVDQATMREAAGRLVGTHDLASFAGGGEGVPWSIRQQAPRGTIRTIFCCDVREIDPWWGPGSNGQLIEIRIVADGFLPRMVRTIAGVLVEIGQQHRDPAWVETLLAGRDRRLAGETAPAFGLTLWHVGYAGEEPEFDIAGVSGSVSALPGMRRK